MRYPTSMAAGNELFLFLRVARAFVSLFALVTLAGCPADDKGRLPPKANFSFSQIDGTLIVQFVNESVSTDTSQWDFGDSSPVEATTSPEHEYALPGIYEVGLRVVSAGGEDTDVSIVEVAAVPPIVILDADPNPVLEGASTTTTTLTWQVDYATGCMGSGGEFDGAKNASAGREVVDVLVNPTTFRLNCTGLGGKDFGEVTVAVTPKPNGFIVAETPVDSGSDVQLQWSVSDAESCTARGSSSFTGPVNTSGSQREEINVPTKFELDCMGPGGSTDFIATVELNSTPSIAVNLTADPTIIFFGNETTLEWTVAPFGGVFCEGFEGNFAGPKFQSPRSQVIVVEETTTYRLECTRFPGGFNFDSVTVTKVGSSTVSQAESTAVPSLSLLCMVALATILGLVGLTTKRKR